MSKYHRRLKSRRWAYTRLKVFERDQWRCTRCGAAGKLEAHHVEPLHVKPDQDYYKLDGIATVCRKCHILITRAERDNRTNSPYQQLINKLVDDRNTTVTAESK